MQTIFYIENWCRTQLKIYLLSFCLTNIHTCMLLTWSCFLYMTILEYSICLVCLYICFDEIDANKNCTIRNHEHVNMYKIDITYYSHIIFTVCQHCWHAGLNICLYASIAGKHFQCLICKSYSINFWIKQQEWPYINCPMNPWQQVYSLYD